MPTFNCGACERRIKVPDAYAGKRVRCPACKEPQRVPDPASSSVSALDLEALDSGESAVGMRRLRELMIGCGACGKTIRLSTRKLGRTAICPKCKASLKVDDFDLTKHKGDLVDMSHLELEPGVSLMDDTSHGSTLGGSSIQLDGTGTGFGMGDTAMGSAMGSAMGADATDSQSQMRELRELNDLKHSGAISNDEYKQRKAEIYAGKSLAIQAMSRAPDGSSGTRPVKGRHRQSALPGPVKALIVVAVLGVGGFVLWTTVLQGMFSTEGGGDQATADATEPATPAKPATPAPPPQDPQDEDETGDEPLAEAGTSDPAETEEADTASTAEDTLPPGINTQVTIVDEAGVPVPPPEVTDPAVADAAEEAPAVPEVPIIPQATIFQGPMEVKDWPVEWPDYIPPRGLAIARACDVVKQIDFGGNSAMIGVAVGPPATGLEDPTYEDFRREMRGHITTAAESHNALDDLSIRDNNRTLILGPLEGHRLVVTMRGERGKQATVISGIQEDRCVAYWFTGDRALYKYFVDTLGLAQLGER